MTFSFPNLPKLSLWDIGCLYTEQNATDDKPTNETRHKLAELAQAVFDGKLWVEFHPDVGFDFVKGFMPAAARARVDTEWRKLDLVTVRREDWGRYEQLQEDHSEHGTIASAAQSILAVLPEEETRNSIGSGGEVWVVDEAAEASQHHQGLDIVSLSEAMNFIALIIDVPKGRTSADDEPMWRASEAAKKLYQCLHDATGTGPRWMEVHPTIGMPLASDTVANEGMAILLHAAGWYERETTARMRHTLDCVKAGFDPAVVGPASRDPNAGQWDYGKYWMREHQIGFVRDELSAILGMHIGEVSIRDHEEARAILGRRLERLDRIAWAMVTLASDASVQNETCYRQILGVTKWLESLGLQYRTSDSLPASQPKGVSVAGMDVREYQYLVVADVRAAAIADKCWPSLGDAHRTASDIQRAYESSETPGKPLPVQRHQEQEILRVLRELGYNPLALPKRVNGKKWVAAEVRDKLTGPKWTRSIHDKAWERLRENGDINEAD
ncbi:hypothetical protein [Burkholderia sp. LMG 21824]|uniref:hypothetical protein n=1 Tax=Burkholderia sp. LMG 21824 TaxID=3158172 RepID=UPI003C302554